MITSFFGGIDVSFVRKHKNIYYKKKQISLFILLF